MTKPVAEQHLRQTRAKTAAREPLDHPLQRVIPETHVQQAFRTALSVEPMAVLGAVTIMATLFLGLSGNLGSSDDVFAAQQEAIAAAAAAPGYVPF